MKLWVISQSERVGWDTYDSAVVAAPSEKEARQIHPAGGIGPEEWWVWDNWASTPEAVRVKYLGEAHEGQIAGVIVASFNAG